VKVTRSSHLVEQAFSSMWRLRHVSFSLLIDVDIPPLFDVVSWARSIKVVKKRLYSPVARKGVESANAT
jgi:hypothetical protein